MLNKEFEDLFAVSNVVSKILDKSSQLAIDSFSFCRRLSNAVAYYLARIVTDFPIYIVPIGLPNLKLTLFFGQVALQCGIFYFFLIRIVVC